MNRFNTCQDLIGPSDRCVDAPYTDIASSVLVKAIADWRKYRDLAGLPKNKSYSDWLVRCGFISARKELLRFFHSEWCEFLVGAVIDIPYQEFLTLIGVPKAKRFSAHIPCLWNAHELAAQSKRSMEAA